MASFTDQLQLIMSAHDKASKDIRKVVKSVDELNGELDDLDKGGINNVNKSFDVFSLVKSQLIVSALDKVGSAIMRIIPEFIDLSKEAGQIEQISADFDTLSKSIDSTASDSVNILRKSTRGLVKDFDLMAIGNSLMLSGIAKTDEQMGDLVKIADRLGDQTMNTTDRVADFSALLKNQSIARLDNFGISASQVRERIEELQAANQGMARDVAFNTAVIEIAGQKLDLLGDPVENAGSSIQRMQTQFENLRTKALEAISPLLTQIANKLSEWIPIIIPIIEENLPKLIETGQRFLTEFGVPFRDWWWLITDMFNNEVKPAFEELKVSLKTFFDAVGIESDSSKTSLENFANILGTVVVAGVVGFMKVATVLLQVLNMITNIQTRWNNSMLKFGNTLNSVYNRLKPVVALLAKMVSFSTGIGAISRGISAIRGPGFANGADFIVPQGFDNDSFPMRVSSGERVKVTPANQVDNSRSVDVGTVVINNNMAFEMFMNKLNTSLL